MNANKPIDILPKDKGTLGVQEPYEYGSNVGWNACNATWHKLVKDGVICVVPSEYELGRAYIKGRKDEAFCYPSEKDIANCIVQNCGVSSLEDCGRAAKAILNLLKKGKI